MLNIEGGYALLVSDPLLEAEVLRRNASRRRIFFGLLACSAGLLFLVAILGHSTRLYTCAPFAQVPESWFNLTSERPEWLAPPPKFEQEVGSLVRPLVIRLAIISAPDEFEKRDAVRRTMLGNVPSEEVTIIHRFFIGIPSNRREWHHLPWQFYRETLEKKIWREATEYGDVEVLDVGEGGWYLGEKRWMMLQSWGATYNKSTYDFYMGADTDVFLRMAALSRRWRHLRPDANPREEKIVWAHTGVHLVHFQATNDSHGHDEEDPHPVGEWYSYPLGFAYLLTSALVANLTAPGIALAKHVHYPSDDVIIGSWIADFVPDTEFINDPRAFHDMNGRNREKQPPIDWEHIGIHHTHADEFFSFRSRREWRDEWQSDAPIPRMGCH